ncbi:MAG: AAA family ATPase [ANME-2 cluster archaeon]|jgi:energy-coupling factor transporter ATP-binding protein EcfA2|nr:AAA family ATPase [ANME-2 cluster archaeon]
MTGLSAWFKDRPLWVQDAARRLIQQGDITPDDLIELVEICKHEAAGSLGLSDDTSPEPIPDYAFNSVHGQGLLRLKAIKDVVGINALAPRKPLEFGTKSLVIIYGINGSGKSGYMRLLKHVCGAREPGKLLGNVFAAPSQDPGCKIEYTCDGQDHELEWISSEGVISDLENVAIYDTDCAHVYVDKEHEVSYEPPMLGLFRQLVDACDQVDKVLSKEIESKVSALPKLPNEYSDTDAASWFEKIDNNTLTEDVASHCTWTDDDAKALNTLNQRLLEVDPQSKADSLRKAKEHLAQLIKRLTETKTQLSDEAFKEFLEANEEAGAKRRAATDDADRIFANAPLDGVASESWRLLWEQARRFSKEVAYPANPFPNTGVEARCVLCQQLLEDDAKVRLQSFEYFVKGNLEQEASEAEQKVIRILEELTDLPDVEQFDSMLDLASVKEEALRKGVSTHFLMLRARREQFGTEDDLAKLSAMPNDEALDGLVALEKNLEEQVSVYEQDAQTNDRTAPLKQRHELEVRKWLTEQRASIESEIERQKSIALLEITRRLTHTKALTLKASSLSEELVTEAFKKRFQDELNLLGATRLRVEIEKVKAAKGQVLHKLMLTDAKMEAHTRDVLSDGEFRIVSIAAFLADVATEDYDVPFIFDDPISSLDQDYEGRVAQRFVGLAQFRQVIVFTHRLSLLSALQNASEKQGVDNHVISLLRQSWGIGEPGGPPLPAQKPKTALNTLLNERLGAARKVYEETGRSEYIILAKALCSDIRITIERLIENDLLADVVQRFRLPINTMGKLHKVAKITSKDCEYIDEMMTKYSRYEHAQPEESPIELPEPDELEQDLKGLKAWLDEFSGREVPA